MSETSPRPRGRPRKYKTESALQQATAAFWRAGFSGSSLDDLSNAMEMNRPSIYSAFGGKRDLYLAVLDRYVVDSAARMEQILDSEPRLATGLRAVYAAALDMYFPTPEVSLGCFLIGTATVEAVDDAEIGHRLRRGLATFDAVFESRFKRALDANEVGNTLPAAMRARMASAVLHSLAVRARAGESKHSLELTADAAVQLLLQ